MPVTMETRALTKILLENASIQPNGEQRIRPELDVRNHDRLHLHVGRNAKSVAGLSVRVLFSTPLSGLQFGAILADSTVWFEETATERVFEWTAPLNYGRTGFIVSVPVVAPVLYDVIVRNTGTAPIDEIYVALMAQEI